MGNVSWSVRPMKIGASSLLSLSRRCDTVRKVVSKTSRTRVEGRSGFVVTRASAATDAALMGNTVREHGWDTWGEGKRLQCIAADVGENTVTIRSLDWDRDRFDIEFGLQVCACWTHENYYYDDGDDDDDEFFCLLQKVIDQQSLPKILLIEVDTVKAYFRMFR